MKGYKAFIDSSDDYAQIGSSDDYARIYSSGYSSQICSSGSDTKIVSSGSNSRICSSGDCSQINSEGKYAVICCAGDESIAKGKIGSWITLSEWKFSKEENDYIPIFVKTEKIDGVKIKEDTYYRLVNGEFTEA